MTCEHGNLKATCDKCAILALVANHDALAAEVAALRQRNEELRSANEWVELESERDALRARLAEETAIVDRIWDIYGRPTSEQLAGRSLYDLINTDRARLALPTTHVDMADYDLLAMRLATAEALLREAHDNHWPFMARNELGDRIGAFLAPADSTVKVSTCAWMQDRDSDMWETQCGLAWCFEDGGPVSNGAKFCIGCGKPLVEMPYVEPPVCDECGEELQDGKCPDCTTADQPTAVSKHTPECSYWDGLMAQVCNCGYQPPGVAK